MDNDLDLLRQEIDSLDAQILELFARRMDLVQKVGAYKKQHGIIPLDEGRWKSVLNSKLEMAEKLGLDSEMIRDIYNRIHDAALKLESVV